MRLRHRVHDRQAEADAMPVDASEAIEALKRLRVPAGGNAGARIVDGEYNCVATPRAAHFEAPADGGETNRVDDQVAHQQMQAELFGQQLPHLEPRLQRKIALGRRRTEVGHHVSVDLFQVHKVQGMPAGRRKAVDSREIEQLIEKVAGLVDTRHQMPQGSRQLLR
jgi:hypothetical protein